MEREIRVFLIAGNRLLRQALTRILNKRSDTQVVGAVPFSAQAVEQIVEAKPDVLLLDSVTADLSDLEFVCAARQAVADLKIVMIGMEPDAQIFLDVVRAGVVGYVLKDAGAMDVVAAVRGVMQNEAACPPGLCLSLFNYVAGQGNGLPNGRIRVRLGLTRRQQQLVPLIAQGCTNKEIAAQLNLSEQTVKNHIHRMLQKVGASDRLSVVEVCRGQGFKF